MSKYEEIVEHFSGMTKLAMDSLRKFAADMQEEKFATLDTMEAGLEQYKQTGVLSPVFCTRASNIEQITEEGTLPKQRGRPIKESNPENSLKENSGATNPERPRATGQRKAFVDASQMTNTNNVNGITQNVVVKLEKLGEEFIKTHSEIPDMAMKQLENNMPPPTEPLIRQTRNRRGTRTTNASNAHMESVAIKVERMNTESKKKTARAMSSKQSASLSRDSDVLFTPESVVMVNLVESDEEDSDKPTQGRGRPRTKRKRENEVPESTRATRTKTRNAEKDKQAEVEQQSALRKKQSVSSSSTEDDAKEKKPGKRTKKLAANKKNKDNSVYEDALSDEENLNNKIVTKTKAGTEQTGKSNQAVGQVEAQPSRVMNETVVLSKSTALNATVVIEKPKKPVLMNETVVLSKFPNGKQQLEDDLMTDDEDIVVSPVNVQKPKKVKPVFRPYAPSPVKQRVEAFEKLGAVANSEMPPRTTHKKTKAEEQTEKETKHSENEAATENIPNSAKHSAIPKLQTTPTTALRTPLQSAVHSAVPRLKTSQAAPLSGLKASQASYRERELRRNQKEAEGLSKKEALMQAQTEERRRRREERQLKAQQTREAVEKEKQKHREEIAHNQALKKAAEEKYKEEERKRLEDKRKRAEEAMYNKQKAMKVPAYLRYEKPPLLPTGDCYDSDDPDAKPYSTPHWQKKEVIFKTITNTSYIKGQIQNLFRKGPATVDLREFFPSIEPHRLKRTSSAIWNKSGLSKLASLAEEDDS